MCATPWVQPHGHARLLHSPSLGAIRLSVGYEAWPVLEIPTGLPVRGQHLWRRARNFLFILLQFYVYALRESIPRLLNEGTTTMTARCAPACSQALPVKPQGVWARGIEAWARSRRPPKLEFRRWRSSGPSSLMIWDSRHDDLQLFWLSFKHWASRFCNWLA